MNEPKHSITVVYDGACPRCICDRAHDEQWAGPASASVCGFDLTGQAERLSALGLDPGPGVDRTARPRTGRARAGGGRYRRRSRSTH